jgi:hypothetical protein
MSALTKRIQEALRQDGFPFRVAIYPGHVPELGEVVEVNAFDVPEAGVLDVSRRLNRLLCTLRTQPMAVGTAFLDAESDRCAANVPDGAIWLAPDGTASRTQRPTGSR